MTHSPNMANKKKNRGGGRHNPSRTPAGGPPQASPNRNDTRGDHGPTNQSSANAAGVRQGNQPSPPTADHKTNVVNLGGTEEHGRALQDAQRQVDAATKNDTSSNSHSFNSTITTVHSDEYKRDVLVDIQSGKDGNAVTSGSVPPTIRNTTTPASNDGTVRDKSWANVARGTRTAPIRKQRSTELERLVIGMDDTGGKSVASRRSTSRSRLNDPDNKYELDDGRIYALGEEVSELERLVKHEQKQVLQHDASLSKLPSWIQDMNLEELRNEMGVPSVPSSDTPKKKKKGVLKRVATSAVKIVSPKTYITNASADEPVAALVKDSLKELASDGHRMFGSDFVDPFYAAMVSAKLPALKVEVRHYHDHEGLQTNIAYKIIEYMRYVTMDKIQEEEPFTNPTRNQIALVAYSVSMIPNAIKAIYERNVERANKKSYVSEVTAKDVVRYIGYTYKEGNTAQKNLDATNKVLNEMHYKKVSTKPIMKATPSKDNVVQYGVSSGSPLITVGYPLPQDGYPRGDRQPPSPEHNGRVGLKQIMKGGSPSDPLSYRNAKPYKSYTHYHGRWITSPQDPDSVTWVFYEQPIDNVDDLPPNTPQVCEVPDHWINRMLPNGQWTTPHDMPLSYPYHREQDKVKEAKALEARRVALYQSRNARQANLPNLETLVQNKVDRYAELSAPIRWASRLVMYSRASNFLNAGYN